MRTKLVLMSGSGTVAPMYDFKILYEKLVSDFRVMSKSVSAKVTSEVKVSFLTAFIFRCIPLLIIMILTTGICAEAREKAEPDVDYSYDIESIHVGQSCRWTPFAGYPDLPVTYSSSEPECLSIDGDGTLTAIREGSSMISASTPETSELEKSEYGIFLYVLSEKDGLYEF